MTFDCRRILDAFADAVIAADSEGRIVYANRKTASLLGWSEGALMGRELWTIVPNRLREMHPKGLDRYIATREAGLIGRPTRVPAQRADGSEVEVELTLTAFQDPHGDFFVASLRDLSDRSELERQFTVSRYLRAATAAATQLATHRELPALLQSAVQTLVDDFDASLARLWLYEPESHRLAHMASAGSCGPVDDSLGAVVDIEKDPSRVAEVFRTAQPFTHHDLAGDPELDPAWVTREPLCFAAGFPLLVAGQCIGVLLYYSRCNLLSELVEVLGTFASLVATSIHDLQLLQNEQAARREAEAARAEAERQRDFAQRVFRHAPIGVALTDGPEHRFIFVNPTGSELIGLPASEIVGRTTAELLPESYGQFAHLLQGVMESGEPLVVPDLQVQMPGGRLLNFLVSYVPIPGPDGQPAGILHLGVDTTEIQRTQAELRESEARFRTVFEGAGIGIALVGPQGNVLQVNPALQRMLGYSEEELQRMSVAEFTHPEDYQADAACFQELVDGKRSQYQVEKRYLRRDGTVVWGRLTVSIIRDPQGRPQFATSLVEDVTEQRRAAAALAESNERLRAIVENSPSVVFLKDLEGRYLLMNHHSHTRLWDQPPEAVIGKTDFDLFSAGVAEMVRANDRQVLEAGRTLEFEEYEEGENPRWFISSKFPLFRPDGAPFALGGISTEITEQKRLQAELQRHLGELAEADRRKDEFLATLAHELRNPLAGIHNSLYLLRRHGSQEPRACELRQVIGRQAEYLTRLVDDLLDVSRITRGLIDLHLQPVDVGGVVSSAVEATRRQIEKRKQELTVALAPERLYVWGDIVRLEQVLVNLLSNASKYTEPGGRIRLSVERSGGEVVIRVSDTGVGIAAELLPKVFDLFTQAERSYARTHGGLGIGLHIVQRLVELHGGSVTGHSDGLNRGSEFTVHLPLTDHRQTHAPLSGGSRSSQGPSRRTLVIEDNADAAETLQEILELAGHRVELAFSGPEGVRKALESPPEVVVCDIGLPGMDGYAVARELRGLEQTAHCRLIALTGFGQDEDRRRAHEAGFDIHLTKPVDIAELERAILGS